MLHNLFDKKTKKNMENTPKAEVSAEPSNEWECKLISAKETRSIWNSKEEEYSKELPNITIEDIMVEIEDLLSKKISELYSKAPEVSLEGKITPEDKETLLGMGYQVKETEHYVFVRW